MTRARLRLPNPLWLGRVPQAPPAPLLWGGGWSRGLRRGAPRHGREARPALLLLVLLLVLVSE